MNYFLRPEISSSDIAKIFSLTNAEFIHYYEKRQVEMSKKSKEMVLGSVFHSLVTNQESDEFVISPFENFRTDKAKEWRDSQTKIIMSKDGEEVATALKMVESVKSHKMINKLISGIYDVEKEFYGVSDNLLNLRIKIDGLYKNKLGEVYLIDFKTTGKLKDFEKSFTDFKYYMRLAFYKEVLNQNSIQIKKVYLPVVSSSEPFDCELFEIPEDVLQLGEYEFKDGLQQIKQAFEEQNKEKTVKTIGLTDYVERKLIKKYFN